MRRSSDSLIAVERLFGGYYFAPSFESIGPNANEKNQPRIDAAEAGLKRFLERQTNEPQAHALHNDRFVGNQLNV
jgi:hypothetical protein